MTGRDESFARQRMIELEYDGTYPPHVRAEYDDITRLLCAGPRAVPSQEDQRRRAAAWAVACRGYVRHTIKRIRVTGERLNNLYDLKRHWRDYRVAMLRVSELRA